MLENPSSELGSVVHDFNPSTGVGVRVGVGDGGRFSLPLLAG